MLARRPAWPRAIAHGARDAIRAIPQRLRERQFWQVQALVIAVTAFHYTLELAGHVEGDGLMHDIAMTMYTIPLLYASLIFGWEGAVMTGLLASTAMAPGTFMLRENGLIWLTEVGQLAIVIAVGLVVAWRVDREARQRKIAEQTSEQLFRARQEADNASHAKSEFLSRMSHELRTPLNVILGFGQLLEVDVDDDASRIEYVDHILGAGRHLLDLVNEALDLSRAESGRLAISFAPVELRSVIDEAVQLVAPLAAQRHISVATSGTEAAGWARADSQRLKQVFLNLLSNAIKYSAEGGSVVVTARAEVDGRTRAEVIDNGPGVAADKLDRLFAPFDRLGAEATQIEGTGLGLTIAKALLEAMGGSIGVVTTPGKGSTFWLELESALPPAGRETIVPVVPAARPVAARKLRVLYIEDNVANLTLIRRICERRPTVELSTAMQGSVGLELVRQQRPDLILLDLHLPDLSGADVLRELKRDPNLAEIPVIVVSADAIPSQVHTLLEAGARNYVTKPIHVDEILGLFDEVSEALARARTSDRAGGGADHILVVDDDAALRKLIGRILSGQGYRVTMAADAAEAISASATNRVDLLLTDVILPGMLGPELARSIQQTHPGIAVLYVTGHADDELTARHTMPTEALLQKPFTADSLVSMTRTLIEARHAAAS